MYHGMSDLSLKGRVKEYNGSPVMNWWVPGSKCDQLGGQDGGTLAPGVLKEDSMDLFIDLMCRRIDLVYEQEETYPEELVANRYIPPPNAMGSPDDKDPQRQVIVKSFCLLNRVSCPKFGHPFLSSENSMSS